MDEEEVRKGRDIYCGTRWTLVTYDGRHRVDGGYKYVVFGTPRGSWDWTWGGQQLCISTVTIGYFYVLGSLNLKSIRYPLKGLFHPWFMNHLRGSSLFPLRLPESVRTGQKSEVLHLPPYNPSPGGTRQRQKSSRMTGERPWRSVYHTNQNNPVTSRSGVRRSSLCP